MHASLAKKVGKEGLSGGQISPWNSSNTLTPRKKNILAYPHEGFPDLHFASENFLSVTRLGLCQISLSQNE